MSDFLTQFAPALPEIFVLAMVSLILVIDAAKKKKKFRLLIEPRARAVEDGRHMLAHVGPVGAGTVQPDLLRKWEQSARLVRHNGHDLVGEFALKEFKHRADPPRAMPL
jgi:hypothetical protein